MLTTQPTSAVVISTTNATSVPGSYAFTVLSNAVISAASGNLSGYSGVTFPAGVTVHAALTSITLASGSIIVYSL